jgi:hypothetical protein
MDSNLKHAVSQLERGAMLRLNDAAGRTLAVFKGMVWVTQDRDPRDVFVAAGETFRVDRPGLVLVEAMDDSSLIVLEPRTAAAGDEHAAA